MKDHDLSARLRSLGTQRVPTETRDAHLQRMAALAPTAPRREKRFGRLAVAAAAIVGFLAGSTGLAMAGALPDPAQGAAHDVLSVVQIEVPEGRQGNGPPDFILEDPCKGPPPWAGPYREAGAEPQQPTAQEREAFSEQRAACPEDTGRPDGVGRPEGVGRSGDHPHAGDPCKGPPPWAGTPDQELTPQQEQAREEAFEAERAAECGADDQDVEEPEG